MLAAKRDLSSGIVDRKFFTKVDAQNISLPLHIPKGLFIYLLIYLFHFFLFAFRSLENKTLLQLGVDFYDIPSSWNKTFTRKHPNRRKIYIVLLSFCHTHIIYIYNLKKDEAREPKEVNKPCVNFGVFQKEFLRNYLVYGTQILWDNWNCYDLSIFKGFILLASSDNDKPMLMRQ